MNDAISRASLESVMRSVRSTNLEWTMALILLRLNGLPWALTFVCHVTLARAGTPADVRNACAACLRQLRVSQALEGNERDLAWAIDSILATYTDEEPPL